MQGNLIIFAGAGASRGVSDKYPTALDFLKQLPKEVTQRPLYRMLHLHFTEHKKPEEVIDIETVLWELGTLMETLKEFTEPQRFLARALSNGRTGAELSLQHLNQHTVSQASSLRHTASELQNAINKNIYEFYSQAPGEDELERSWLPLMRWVAGTFVRVDIVTTNYDLVIEHALEKVPALQIQRTERPGFFRQIDLAWWEPDGSPKHGLLTKLHGSVDWQLGKGGTEDRPVIRPGIPEFSGDHDSRPIIYPGFKGRPARQPFMLFHEHFRQRVTKATHLLFIGFAFRDDFINEIIQTSRQPGSKVAVVDPAVSKLPTGLPFLSGAHQLAQGFGVLPPTAGAEIDENRMQAFNLNDLMSWA
jgi:hypothetical protein